ncbi:MAG: ribosome biogenesis GTPase YlqF [Oscillospiraceae bacterium]|nr:ribosome biogenesis GTPase YlqF [Oscillospiraceae bacterium]
MNIQWYPGHMAKTRRIIEENLAMTDIVVEILDARIPYSGRNPDFNDILKNKPRLLLLNKYDLADKRVSDKWISRYKEQGINVIPISCATGMGINRISSEAEKMMGERIARDKKRGVNRSIKLMMTGIPNVGKSSLINRLIGKAGAKTGDRPGVTKGKQWFRLKSGIEFLDTPGILPTKFDDQERAKLLAYTGAIKDEIINTELLAYSLLEYLRDNYRDILSARYKLTDDISDMEGYQILEYIGKKRGFVVSGGETDTERAANILLDEFRGAKIGNISLETPEDIDIPEK